MASSASTVKLDLLLTTDCWREDIGQLFVDHSRDSMYHRGRQHELRHPQRFTVRQRTLNPYPLKSVDGDRLSSALALTFFVLTFDIYETHLNDICFEQSLELACPGQLNSFPWHALGVPPGERRTNLLRQFSFTWSG